MFKTIGLAILVVAVGTTPSVAKKIKECKKDCVAVQAPEIDGSSGVAGLTLLAGGIAIMLGRRTQRLQTQAE